MPPTPPTQNRALILARESLGWSRAKLARSVSSASEGRISADAAFRALKRMESGEVQAPTEIYRVLICKVLRTSPGELFATSDADSASRPSERRFTVTCRKYVPVVTSPHVAQQIAQHPGMKTHEIDGVPASRASLPWPHDTNTDTRLAITVFGFGGLVAELRQTVDFESLAELAVWRHTSYEIDRPRVGALLRQTWPSLSSEPTYVLGTWWLAQSGWGGQDLDTAVRIMSTPSALLKRQGDPTIDQLKAGAEIAEKSAFRTGFDAGPGLVDFGVPGVSVAYATWSGVAYAPVAVDRALHPDELGDFETLCQGLWALCSTVCSAVEVGEDPQIDDSFGWRWLRGVASRITRPRPTETRQVRCMRDAVVDTSQLRTMLPDTIDLLRDAASTRIL